MLTIKEQLTIINRGVVEIIREEELKARLAEDRPLKIKFGADPTAPDIHLGHTVVLRKLKQFQDLGHEIQFIIGDFTSRIGDPSGRSETRPPLEPEQITANAATYQDQVFKILDPNRTKVFFNSEWLEDLSLADILKVSAYSTVARMLERDDFAKRYAEGRGIGLHELLYPLIQGYDSVILKSDVEIGGTDQKFNLLMGRDLQREYDRPPQIVITMPLLEGLDGTRKMSKSLGNYVGVTEPAQEIYGKLMSIPDSLMIKYYELLTDIPLDEIAAIKDGLERQFLHPKEVKRRLAGEIVQAYYDEQAAREADVEFERIFKEKQIPGEMPLFSPPDQTMGLIDLIFETGLAPSKSQARRLINQGAVKINQKKVSDINLEVTFEEEQILQVGKRGFVKIAEYAEGGW
ncbi:MAG: tyrosine--tRNA ligase [bacterium]